MFPRIAAIGRLAAWLKPEDVEPALRSLSLLEAYGQIGSREADAWRRITGWARYHEEGAETAPSG